ncbi:transcriptional regulator, TetR family [Blastococcus aggregatus]|uniref:Transcriptional regulator, TetR family n=1 Tax=Blastococcus aggregatus TaxID=38502 RepID=A0A285VH07_9ACTN|nr:transcriptional regulator, TetR family [Blastococcus aggregatus]
MRWLAETRFLAHHLCVTETGDWRKARWEATHRRIFTCALALFQDFGFEQVSVGQIAARAKVSVPTFYAHFPSKEHLIMALPTPEQISALIAGQPAELTMAERLRRAVPRFIAAMPPDEHEEMAARWRIIADTPALRIRAAEFERTTAGMFLDSLPGVTGAAPAHADVVQAGAYLAAYTAALLTWADSKGRRKLDELIDEAFRALGG